jgi:hypothetical protein
MDFSTDFGGTIPKDMLEVNAFAGNEPIQNHTEIPPTPGNTHLEVTHVFDQSLPFTVWNIIVPEFLLRAAVRRHFNPGFIVRREVELHALDEHKVNDTYYQATADRYTQRNVKIRIMFHPQRPSILNGGVLEAQLLKRTGIQRVYFRNTGNYSHEWTFRKLHNERVRIPFRFPATPIAQSMVGLRYDRAIIEFERSSPPES